MGHNVAGSCPFILKRSQTEDILYYVHTLISLIVSVEMCCGAFRIEVAICGDFVTRWHQMSFFAFVLNNIIRDVVTSVVNTTSSYFTLNAAVLSEWKLFKSVKHTADYPFTPHFPFRLSLSSCDISTFFSCVQHECNKMVGFGYISMVWTSSTFNSENCFSYGIFKNTCS